MILAGVLAVDWNSQKTFRVSPIPWRAVMIFGAILLVWGVWATLYFGSPLPVTLEAKRAQGLMNISELFAPSFFKIARQYSASYWLEGTLFLVGVGVTLWRKRGWLLLLSWAGLHFLIYAWLGVTRYFWYYAPLVPGIVGMIGLGLDAVKRSPLPARTGRRSLAWLAKLTLAGLAAAQIIYLTGPRFYSDPRLEPYRMAGEWLAKNTPSGASIGALEVGIIGYYAKPRPMVDFAGLIQPEVAHVFAPETTYQDSAAWAFQQYQPDYVVLQVGLFPAFEREHVIPNCAAIQTFPSSETGYTFDLEIFHCQYP